METLNLWDIIKYLEHNIANNLVYLPFSTVYMLHILFRLYIL